MSKYTTEIRFICETAAGLTESEGFNSVDDILSKAAPLVFNFNWPIFDENYRLPLEIKILRHYYTREIGAETVGLWKLQLQQKLYEIMPYYNQLYESQLLKFNPFDDVDLTTDHTNKVNGANNTKGEENSTNTNNGEETTNGSGNSNASGNNNNTTTNTNNANNTAWDMYSDTPQGSIQNIGLENNNYLTNARKNTSNGTITDNGTNNNTYSDKSDYSNEGKRNTSNTNTGEKNTSTDTTYNSTEDYIQHIKGRNGGRSYMQSLKEFRESFLNIDKLVIDELATLFFNLW